MIDSEISFMVIVKDPNAQQVGLGKRSFRIVPRVGEYIGTNNVEGQSVMYKVKAVMHPLEPQTTCGDLVVESAGNEIDLLRGL